MDIIRDHSNDPRRLAHPKRVRFKFFINNTPITILGDRPDCINFRYRHFYIPPFMTLMNHCLSDWCPLMTISGLL